MFSVCLSSCSCCMLFALFSSRMFVVLHGIRERRENSSQLQDEEGNRVCKKRKGNKLLPIITHDKGSALNYGCCLCNQLLFSCGSSYTHPVHVVSFAGIEIPTLVAKKVLREMGSLFLLGERRQEMGEEKMDPFFGVKKIERQTSFTSSLLAIKNLVTRTHVSDVESKRSLSAPSFHRRPATTLTHPLDK